MSKIEKEKTDGNFTYFEETPSRGHLDEMCYDTCARIVGRPCLDVALIVENQLVLVERSVKPMHGPYMAGGRIYWEKFRSVLQYASFTIQEHFGIEVNTDTMTLLEPRFVCFTARPYPEVCFWVVANITAPQFKDISLSLKEQNSTHLFKTKTKLMKHLELINASKTHVQILSDLWEELRNKDIIR